MRLNVKAWMVTFSRRSDIVRTAFVFIVFLICVCQMLLIWRSPISLLQWDMKDAGLCLESQRFINWKGFSADEKGFYNFSVVTALLDIGRGAWRQQRRGFGEYLLYMQHLLRLDVNMVVYVERSAKPMIEWMRRGRESRTHIIVVSVSDLPYYKYREKIQAIMHSTEYQFDNELVSGGLCEATVPEYDILQWSKLYFVDRATRDNAFNNSFYVWLDASYARDGNVIPSDGVWTPHRLLEHEDRVTFILRGDIERYRHQSHRLHKISVNILVGGFFAGGVDVVRRVYALQQDLARHWMNSSVVDDDQTMYMLLYYDHPEMFRLVSGEWFDAFRLFSS